MIFPKFTKKNFQTYDNLSEKKEMKDEKKIKIKNEETFKMVERKRLKIDLIDSRSFHSIRKMRFN